jgi:hypothetical protein
MVRLLPLLLATLVFPDPAGAQLKNFRSNGQGGNFVVLTGPELSPSWGDWAFFPYALASPGTVITGTIRIFPGKNLSSVPESERTDVARQMLRVVPDLALVSVPDPSKMSSIFPPAVEADDRAKALKEGKELPVSAGTFVPISRKETQWLLSPGKDVHFTFERLSPVEFSLTLSPGGRSAVTGEDAATAAEAAALRAQAAQLFKFEEIPLKDVLHTISADNGIPLSVPDDSTAALLQRVTYSQTKSPFAALEDVVRQYGAELVLRDGVWSLQARLLSVKAYCPRQDNYWGIVVSRGGDVWINID